MQVHSRLTSAVRRRGPLPTAEHESGAPRLARPSSSSVFVVATIVLAGVLLILSLRGVGWSEMRATLSRAQGQPLVYSFLFLTLSYVCRAMRWRLLLPRERPIATGTVFWATSVGYLGNCFLPARAGELIRSALLNRSTGVPVSYALATTLTERVIDVLALVSISVVTLPQLGHLPPWLYAATKVMAFIGAGGLCGLILAPRFEPALRRLVLLLPLRSALWDRILRLLGDFLLGMQALQRPRVACGCFLLTILVWLSDAGMALQVAYAFGLTLSLLQVLLLLAALGLASAAPSTPGFVGIYQFVAVTVLPPFGISRSDALVYILAVQAVIYLVVIVWGGLGIWRLAAIRPAGTYLGL